MTKIRLTGWLSIAAALVVAGCTPGLDVTNPNAPDAKRALSDPAALEAVAGGTLRTWFTGYDGMYAVGPLTTIADSYSSSWNNYYMLYINSQDADGQRLTRPWKNDPSANERLQPEWYWTKYYSAISSASDVLKAIRTDGVKFATASDTKRSETIAQFVLGMATSGIAINYDKGYVIDEKTDVSALAYSDRKKMREAALAQLDAAIALASANTFTTPAAWTNGRAYTNVQIAQIANTMAAMTIAYWPRNDAENTAADWARVAGYAAKGMSSGTPFDFVFVGDGCTAWCHENLTWFDGIDTGVIHTRVAHAIDPLQKDPYPVGGNPQPVWAPGKDKRMGDGTFGDPSLVDGFGNKPVTASSNPGTDFSYSTYEIFAANRGQYHQSNIGHIRYDLSRNQDPTGIYGGYGPAPVVTAGQNDLLWAEGLIRSNGDLAKAATLINNSRVTRGGLAPASAADGAAGLLVTLQTEQDIELLGLGSSVFYNRRRLAGTACGAPGILVPGNTVYCGLRNGTPAEFPVPAKELGVRGEALYTFGGTGLRNSPTPP
jgi:hypothetical protein